MKDHEPQPHLRTIEEIASIAKENLRRDGFHIPTIIAQGSRTTVAFQFTEFGRTPQARRQHLYQAGILVGQEGAVGILWQVFYVGEGWMSRSETDKAPDQLPSQDPQRKEILFVAHGDVRGLEFKDDMRIWEMVRNSAGKLVDFVAFDHETNIVESSLVDFVAGYAIGLLKGPN